MKKSEGISFTIWLGEYYKLNLHGSGHFRNLRKGWDDNLTPEEMVERGIDNAAKEHNK
tara:strand:+ start:12288 stop:12461 length:174 start_codon:yes stop_codon:yes gene_type:complete